MATYVIEGQQLTNIADAIRSKTDIEDTMTVDEMPIVISDIMNDISNILEDITGVI